MRRGIVPGLVIALLLPLGAHAVAADRTRYAVNYTVQFQPGTRSAHVTIATTPGTGRLISLDLAMPAQEYSKLDGDGSLLRDGDRVRWVPPQAGGAMSYTVEIPHRRDNGEYDSRITSRWVITRGDRLVPPARVRATAGSESAAKLSFELPAGWSDVETPFTRVAGGFAVTNPRRNFDRPVGWIAAGDLATMREEIAGVRVTLAAPGGERADHVATFAILRLALPKMREAFGKLPPKVLIVRSGDPMWRGGLSAPRSLWLHLDRPLISANGTSPLLHELTHVFTSIRGAPEEDWIGEGLAEFYSLDIARRAGLISPGRFRKAVAAAGRSGEAVETLRAPSATRDRTRKAVALFAALDAELRANANADLDALTRLLMRRQRVSLSELKADAAKVGGTASQVLAAAR